MKESSEWRHSHWQTHTSGTFGNKPRQARGVQDASASNNVLSHVWRMRTRGPASRGCAYAEQMPALPASGLLASRRDACSSF